MIEESFQLQVPGGVRYTQCWLPDSGIRAIVMLCHGIAEHCGRYRELISSLSTAGCGVYAVDHIGHGRSPGLRCYIDSFDELVDPIVSLRSYIKNHHPETPVFVLGHSMGGLIALTYALRDSHRISGCIVSGPAIAPPEPIPLVQRWLIRLLSRFLPRLGALKLDASGISRDPEVIAAYRNDPLVYTGSIRARMLAELISASERLIERLPEIKLPILALHGGDDQLTAPEGSQLLFDNCQSEDKQLHIYPGLYHEIFNEKEKRSIYKTVVEWLKKH